MSNLDEKLYDIYLTYKDHENPPVPIDTIKEYLELQGISLENGGEINSQNTDEKNRKSTGGTEVE
jgi:hypothetical protein